MNFAKKTIDIQPVILAGGVGSRLWPLSRALYPKQIMNLTGDKSLFQLTWERCVDTSDGISPWIITGMEHRFLIKEQLEGTISEDPTIIVEPCGKNTAPAVAAAAFYAQKLGRDPVLLVCPSDHVIKRPSVFKQIVQNKALELAQDGLLVTIGIKPTSPETGYGYIKKGRDFKAIEFIEKPDTINAEKMVSSGDYFWNAGIFVMKVSTFLDELKRLSPQVFKEVGQSVERAKKDGAFLYLDEETFTRSPEDSIDYAVMEKTDKVAVVPGDMGWSDVGSWKALWEIGEKDEHGNVIFGDVMENGCKDCYILSTGRLISAIGLEDIIIVETKDAVLVAPKKRAQDVKAIVRDLKDNGRNEAIIHKKVHRPWGTYETVDIAPRFQVKRITVKPGASLSLQMHHHRAEHWIVVKGTAKIQRGNEVILLTENQSTYIPIGEKHRLENPGIIPLELVEVQSGSYLGEDDIVRFDDDYGRT
ncbi:Mannose-1-phosphate guanylyltransferase (GDP) [Dissulfuribacter thermophilus]|uniref:mannose-1-phosphate guanylyltransferase n=1 Tax=Dissulfuribacter thermophilus TaxID=1156395 RepID=A0A1B9F8P5_9BACT|nr:mannose-1-phosphate guanylyltransferase/mannose-6-phosphate isomerase [Dissulfuribacter thermophilus]OCC16253.1 Mannose-1-phosphate guanylyltransferase (GDP) [Dissulfuribacter thermophilus]